MLLILNLSMQIKTYGEFFDIPAPEELVFISWFEGGEIFRSGCTYQRRQGKIFYFDPGHGAVPVFGNARPLEKVNRKKENYIS